MKLPLCVEKRIDEYCKKIEKYSKQQQKQYGVVGIKISLQNYEGNVSTKGVQACGVGQNEKV